MPGLIPIIVAGSIFVTFFTLASVFRSGLAGTIWAAAFLVFVFSMVYSVNNVEGDTMRVLDRDGEPFRVLESGRHFIATTKSYGDSNFRCSPQTHTTEENISVVNEEISFWHVSVDIDWQLICTPEKALAAANLIDTPRDKNIQDTLFSEHINKIATAAIEQCAPKTMSIEETTARAIAQYYDTDGNICVSNFMKSNTDIVEINGISNYQVQPAVKQNLNFSESKEDEKCEC